MMERIIKLKGELSLNTLKLKNLQKKADLNDAETKEQRELLLQRSNIKDMLIEACLKEIDVRVADDHIGDVCSF